MHDDSNAVAYADPNMGVPEKVKKQSQFMEVMRRLNKNKLAMAGMIVFILFVIVAILAPFLSSYDYAAMDVMSKNQPPSAEHWCGTDDLGRDIFARLLYGTRFSLALGVLAVAVGLFVGIILGCIAGFFGGILEEVIMRLCDIMQSIPSILLAIIISAALGNGLFNTIIALSIGRIPFTCRMIRAQFLSQRKLEYVEAAQATNTSKAALMFKQILPNAISPIIVATTMGIGGTITMAAGLSYIGLGVQSPSPEWGAMLSAAKGVMRYYPYQLLFPGICIAIFVLALNLFGDGLRDALDPKLRN